MRPDPALCDVATLEAGSGVDGLYGDDCGLVVAQQTTIMRSVLAAVRLRLRLLFEGRGVGGDVD